MPIVSNINHYREKVSDITDRFAIKNFVLQDKSAISRQQSLDELFIFNGLVPGICLKGNAIIQINYHEFSFREGDIFTYLPNQLFKVKEMADDFLMETLFLSADYLLQLPFPKDFDLLKKIAANPIQRVNDETVHNMLEFHSLIAKHHRREDNLYRESQIKALVFALLMELAILYSASISEIPVAVSRQELLTDDFFKLMLENYKQERSVAYYADKLCLTPKYLSMTVKKITGYPISDWINEAVVIEAKRMLKMTDLTALQISEELNFPNPSFFGKFFKQYTGMTPLQYKSAKA